MTTENVAVLFTDVVGSTELSRRLSPEAGDEMRREHFSILRRALVEAGGTEVKTLGDGLMAAFGSASAALACAVAMQQGVDADNRGRAMPLGLRIGLSGGEVTREDGDYFGEPVVEAARLCSACDGGQILAAQVVRLMAGRRNRHVCRPLGSLTLKGLPDPVETDEVVWEPLGEVASGVGIPLPGRLAVRPGVGVVGREAETATMADATKRVSAGEGREVLLISGEPGLGKTTLVAHAARAAFDLGVGVLFGHCEEDLATPYQLFAESLGHYVTHVPDEVLEAHVEAHGSELSRLVPALARRIPDLPPSKATDADTERYLLFSAVIGLLAQASVLAPVVLVLDDLQWADAGSLMLLRHLVATEQSMRVLVLGTYRDSELSHAHALRDTLGVLRRQARVSRMELSGLDDRGVVSYMEAAAGHRLDDDGVGLAHAVYRETDGNPFFVSEVLRHLIETGVVVQDANGRWTTSDTMELVALPDSVREVVGGRVARLGKTAEVALSVAAVIGRDFDLDVLTRATGSTEDELLDILDAARAVSLVRELTGPPGHYSFSHALIQHTVYEDLGLTRRARAHRQVAEALEDLCGDDPGARVGELARHWINATQPIDLARAIRYSRQAGEAALDALAPADALGYFAQALDLLAQVDEPDPVLAVDLAIGLGTAQRQRGDPAFRDTLLDAARQASDLGDTRRLVAAALANDRGFYSAVGTIDADKVAVLELALDSLAADDPDRALVLATLCSELTHGSPLERREALADEAVAIAEACGDDVTTVRVLNHVYVPLQVPHLLEESVARTADALERAERLGDPALLFWAAMWRAETAVKAGDVEEMHRCIGIQGSMAEQLDQPVFDWGHGFVLGLQAMVAGDTDRAEELATEALTVGSDSGQPDAGLVYGTQLIIVSGQRGTMSDLIPLIEQMAAETPDISRWLFGSLLAKAHVEAGRTDEARRFLEEFAAAGYDLPLDQLWLTAMVDYSEAAIDCGDPGLAEPLFDRLVPWADQLPATGASALSPVSLYLGGLATVLGRYDEADGYYARSAAFAQRAQAKFFAARTDLAWGTMKARRAGPGDLDSARQLLAGALARATAHGYGNVMARAEGALAALGPAEPR